MNENQQEEPEGNYGRTVVHPNANQLWISSGKHAWDQCMQGTGLTFNAIQISDLEGDNSLYAISTFVERASSNPPNKRIGTGPYSPKTLADILVAFTTAIIKRLFPDLGSAALERKKEEYFPKEDVKKLAKELQNRAGRVLVEGHNANEFGKSVFPIPRISNERTRIFEPDDIPPDIRQFCSKTIDLLHLALWLFKHERYLDLCLVLFTHNAIGRGGEVKFLSYSTMFLDLFYGVLFAQWFQRKTLKTNPSGFAPDFLFPVLCIFFALGCYWACNDGLYRPGPVGEPNSPQRRKALFVFPSLHEVSDGRVAEKVRTIIRGFFPPVIQNYFSGKSLRIGAMSLLAWDPAVTYEESVALGGWTTPSNRDWYVWQYLIAIIPAILALAGYPDVRVLPQLPNIKLLENSNYLEEEERLSPARLNDFILALYRISLPEFSHQQGRHRMLLKTVTAVMIIHFPHFLEKLGMQHSYVLKMVNSLVSLQLPCADTRPRAINILTKWSHVLRKDWKDAHLGGDSSILGRRSIPAQLEKLNATAATLLSSKNDIMVELNSLRETATAQSVEISSLRTQVTTVQDTCTHLVTQNSFMFTRLNDILLALGKVPSPIPDLPANALRTLDVVRGLVENRMEARNTPTNGHTTAPNASTPPNASTAPNAAIAPNAAATPMDQPRQSSARRAAPIPLNVALPRHRVATPGSGTKGVSNFGEALENILTSMYEAKDNYLYANMHGNFHLRNHTSYVWQNVFKGKAKYDTKVRKILTLVDCIWTKEERQKVREHRLVPGRERSFFDEIAQRCRNAVYVIKTYKEYEKESKVPKDHKPNSKYKTQVSGMSNNIPADFALESYLPNWAHPERLPRSGKALRDYVSEKQEELKGAIRQQRLQETQQRAEERAARRANFLLQNAATANPYGRQQQQDFEGGEI